MSVKPPWSPLGQPVEGLLIACGVLLGELLGFTRAGRVRYITFPRVSMTMKSCRGRD